MTLDDRKRMLIEAIEACNSPGTIEALENVLIERAAKALSEE